MGAPHAEYTARLAARREAVARLVRREERISRLRLACVIAAAALAWIGIRRGVPSPAWALAPLAGFVVLVGRHWDTTPARPRAGRAVAFYRPRLHRPRGGGGRGGGGGGAVPRAPRPLTPRRARS